MKDWGTGYGYSQSLLGLCVGLSFCRCTCGSVVLMVLVMARIKGQRFWVVGPRYDKALDPKPLHVCFYIPMGSQGEPKPETLPQALHLTHQRQVGKRPKLYL